MKMRRFLGAICAIICVMSVSGQVVREGEMAMVYYMPQTQLVIDIEYESVILHRGIYADYAKQYLGTTQVINDDAISYAITDIKPSVKTVADYSRMHKVTNAPLLSLTTIGTLYGYGIQNDTPTVPNGLKPVANAPIDNQQINVLPLFEEHIVGKSLAQQAQGAAKLIYRIRENRLYLIGGEVDKTPADGAAMQLALNKMDQLERQLVELFVGRIETTKHHKTIVYTPVKSEETELAYFSEETGFTTAGNGNPITLHITARRQTKGYANSDNKKGPVPSQIYYNLPGSAVYTIKYQGDTQAEGDIQVAQFGVSVPLAQDLIDGKQPHSIRFNTETGNILVVEK